MATLINPSVNAEQAFRMITAGIETLAKTYGERATKEVVLDEFPFLKNHNGQAYRVARAIKWPAANQNNKDSKQ